MTRWIIGLAILAALLILAFWEYIQVLLIKWRDPVFVDTSGEALAKAEAALKNAGIRYTLSTTQGRTGSFARLDAAEAARSKGTLSYSRFADKQSYVYTITVRKKDRAIAREVLGA